MARETVFLRTSAGGRRGLGAERREHRVGRGADAPSGRRRLRSGGWERGGNGGAQGAGVGGARGRRGRARGRAGARGGRAGAPGGVGGCRRGRGRAQVGSTRTPAWPRDCAAAAPSCRCRPPPRALFHQPVSSWIQFTQAPAPRTSTGLNYYWWKSPLFWEIR